MPGKVQPQSQQYQLGEGEFRLSVSSGILTGVAAGTSSAGHLFAARWSPTNVYRARSCVIRRLAVTMKTLTGFTAAQEVGFDCLIARSYTASHTGGTAIDLTTNNAKKRTSFQSSGFTANSIEMATTGALTNGTETLDAQPFMQASYSDLAAAATVQKGFVTAVYPPDVDVEPIILAPNEGIVIRNLILLGAAGTARLTVDLDWLELARY